MSTKKSDKNSSRQQLRRMSSLRAVESSSESAPLMVRNLDGSIVYWNRPAEKQYGWSKRDALGSVSHLLLSTIFPSPLQEINQELLEKGYWEGELIHTLNDGHRVKVTSRWELKNSDAGTPQVVEVNRLQGVLTPESAHFSQRFSRYLQQFWNHRWWFIVPFIAALALIWFLHAGVFNHHHIRLVIE